MVTKPDHEAEARVIMIKPISEGDEHDRDVMPTRIAKRRSCELSHVWAYQMSDNYIVRTERLRF